jgi:ankyrin repeat protein
VPAALSPILDALYHGRGDDAARAMANLGTDNLSIHEAAAMGVTDRIRKLVETDAEMVNAWSSDGFQPLQLAAFFGRPQVAELLLARGGDVHSHAQNSFQVTALHAALAGPTPEIARSLIAAGADVDARQQGGVTPLHEAAANGRLDLVELLLEHGADRLARDDQGRDAADFARDAGHETIVERLAGPG